MNKEIDFIPKDQIPKKRKEIDFEPNESAKRVLRSNHSDLNELKSYLHPRGEKY